MGIEIIGQCRSCGCTEFRACSRQCVDGVMVCRWVEPGLCSFCLYQLTEEAYNAVIAEIERRAV